MKSGKKCGDSSEWLSVQAIGIRLLLSGTENQAPPRSDAEGMLPHGDLTKHSASERPQTILSCETKHDIPIQEMFMTEPNLGDTKTRSDQKMTLPRQKFMLVGCSGIILLNETIIQQSKVPYETKIESRHEHFET